MIYHIVETADWPPSGGVPAPASLDSEDFVHCSFLDQITWTAATHFAERAKLLVLGIDADGLAVVVEDTAGTGERFPHVYGSIPHERVVAVCRLAALPDGTFVLPADLPAPEIDVPASVSAARRTAVAAGFGAGSSIATGVLLRRLVGETGPGPVLEIGTGHGHGTAWLAAGLGAGQRLVTVDLIPVSGERLAGVDYVVGDWTAAHDLGPFRLVFADAAPAKDPDSAEVLATMVAPGGTLVIDDLTPRNRVSPEFVAADPVRDQWLNDQRFAAAERQVSASESVIVARRRG